MRWRMQSRAVAVGCGLALAAASAGLVFARSTVDSYDANIMVHVTESMVQRHNLLVPHSVDPFNLNSPYSFYGLGMSLLFAPFYIAAEHLHQDAIAWAMSANAFVFAATVVVLFRLAQALGGDLRHAVTTACLTGFGTLLLPYTSTGFSEPSVALATALGLLGICLARSRPTSGSMLAGASAGLALLMRTDSLLLIVPFLLIGSWLEARQQGWPADAGNPSPDVKRGSRPLTSKRWLNVGLFLTAFAPFALTVAWYNMLRFGAPWRLGYGAQGFGHPWLTGAWGLLFSPGAGLLWYVPLLVLAVAGWALACRRMPVLVGTSAALLVARIALYAAWGDWPGLVSWGPRFLVPAMPALAVGIGEVVRRFHRLPLAVKLAVPAIAALSLAVQLVGSSVRPEANHMIQAVILISTNEPGSQVGCASVAGPTRPGPDQVLFDWRCFPITDEAQQLLHGQALLTGQYLGPPVDERRLGLLTLLLAAGLDVALVVSGGRETAGELR
ncbi:hypothetical protein [Candidatus Dormibacter sp.]|uniref:hypothetical protein n=1 Tax=Candidatus Dormibacter sp. TaxID=2973982 RepID=UPI003D9B6C77